jgi:hypothetical protein
MNGLFARSRSLLLVVALAVIAAMCIVSTAHAASPSAGAGGIRAGASHATVSSGTPCSFVPALRCQSTDPTVALNIYYYGDTSACTFVWDVSWGDGKSSANLTVTDPADGYVFLTNHTYAKEGAYTIAVTGQVTAGDCVASGFTAHFTWLTAPTPPPAVNTTWSGYGGSGSVKGVGVAVWHVPSLSCGGQGFNPLAPHPAAAQWIGLGGTGGNHDLEQVGILSQCVIGIQFNTLVWEILPQYTLPQPLFQYPIQAGDAISAVVKQNNGKQYYFWVHDANRLSGWTWQDYETQQHSAAVPNSVEWVVEAQAGYTAHFSPITFSGCYYFDAAGHHLKLNVKKAGKFEAKGPHGPYTSVSGRGDSFTVKFVRSS